MSTAGAQFTQLPMFMSAREITSTHSPNEGDREYAHHGDVESDDEVWERKLDESGDKGTTGLFHHEGRQVTLEQHVAANGVKTPVSLEDPANVAYAKRRIAENGMSAHQDEPRPQVFGGHHRIAIMDEYRPHDMIPVSYASDTWDARNFERSQKWNRVAGK